MIRILKGLFDLFFATPESVREERVRASFRVGPYDVRAMMEGKLELGTRFSRFGFGFSEDTWPLVLVGDFRLMSDAECDEYYDLRHFEQRLVLDCKERWAVYEWDSSVLGSHATYYEGIDKLKAAAVPGTDRCIKFHIWSDKKRSVGLNGPGDTVLEVLAKRINYLWQQGRSASGGYLPTWVQQDDVRWKNPDPQLVPDILQRRQEWLDSSGEERRTRRIHSYGKENRSCD